MIVSFKRIVSAALVLALALPAAWLAAQSNQGRPMVSKAVRQAVSGPLRDMVAPPAVPGPPRQIPNMTRFLPPGPGPSVAAADPVRQTSTGSTEGPIESAAATLSLSFDGTSDDDNAAVAGVRVVPPDTEGDVGPNHYVQMNNLVFEIFDKAGNSLLGPLPNNSLWQNLGGICADQNDGDPIVLHDQLADRWVLSQFAIGSDGHQCVAVSQTADPTGAYHLYDFVISPGAFNDYPKMGVWPDGYYLTANEFVFRGPFNAVFNAAIAVAFDRSAMLAGASASFARFDVNSTSDATFFSLQPSHWEGNTAPPAGTPNTFVMSFDDETWGTGGNPDGYKLWDFSADFANGNFSFTALPMVESPEFDANLCNFNACVPQPDNGENLDTLSQFTMYRLHYRNFTVFESLVGNHTVDADGSDTAGIRWFELRRNADSGGWVLHNTGTFAPADGEHRWMASANIDGSGNIGIGYDISSTSTFPSVLFTSRLEADPSGQITGGESLCVGGGGVQTDSSNRWGDYSTASVDPVDECTFWITNEYYAVSGSFDFNTRICAFTLDECTGSFNCTATESPETSCNDDVDNDCDGLRDSNDSDCTGGCVITEDPEVSCSDGVDNDCDGLVDGDDPDCGCVITEDPETSCSDGVDNDCDGLIDADDTDCQTDCAPVGDPCTADSDCCSNKCRGRPGAQTCKS